MYKILIIFVLLSAILVQCSSFADNEAKDVKVCFLPNSPQEYVTHYEIYWWQDDDTTTFIQSDMTLIDTVIHVQTDTLFSPNYSFYSNYIRAGAIAVNINGKSEMALTNFVNYFEFFSPKQPRLIRIAKN
jgi:hypothetical protein